MSIPATMKFIVRGKSVDLKNREGSSPSIPKKTIWLPNYLSYPFYLFYPFFVSGSKFLIFLIHYSLYKWIWAEMLFSYHMWYMIHVQMNIFEQGIPIWMIHDRYFYSYWNLQSCSFVLTNYRTWMRLCNTLSIDIDPSYLVKWKWGWDIRNSRDSSVGRAEDWKSSCHQFKSGSWHMINLYESLFYQLIDMNTYSLRV